MTDLTTALAQQPRWKTGLTIFIAGFLGVLSLLLTDLPMQNIPQAVTQRFTPIQLKLLVLVNPTLLLVVAVTIGTLLYTKVNLQVLPTTAISLVKDGMVPGLVAGLLSISVGLLFKQLIPIELAQLTRNDPHLAVLTRFLYGGVTEEILLRFGLMTLLVWGLVKLSGKTSSWVYWLSIVLAAFVFGIGHLPALYGLVAHPSFLLTLYIILGNLVAGLVFGWVYWRKSLSLAIVAHASTHVVFLTSELLP